VNIGLKVPMAEELVWANVMRPRIPLVYLDLHVAIRMARALSGDTKVPAEYLQLYQAALRAKLERRAMFPLSGEHMWEIAQITDPKQRGNLADILATLSDYRYLAGRTLIAELEIEAGMAKILGEDISDRSTPLLRWDGELTTAVEVLFLVNKVGSHRLTPVRFGLGGAPRVARFL
jgi:hypothetical protein